MKNMNGGCSLCVLRKRGDESGAGEAGLGGVDMPLFCPRGSRRGGGGVVVVLVSCVVVACCWARDLLGGMHGGVRGMHGGVRGRGSVSCVRTEASAKREDVGGSGRSISGKVTSCSSMGSENAKGFLMLWMASS